MTKRSINTSIEELLVSNEPFDYAHLIKFERPFAADTDGKFRTNANRYAYFTDASRDISYNDTTSDQDGNSNGAQIYRANRVLSVGSYSETTTPRATNMSLVLSGDHLGTSISVVGDFSSAAFALDTTFYEGDTIDLVEEGFREGDKIKFTKNSGNFSTGSSSVEYIIAGFSNSNRTLALATTGNDSDDDTTYPTDTNVTVTMSLESEELKGILTDAPTLFLANPTFLNREVFVYKVFFDPDTGDIVGNTAITTFKGIIATCSLDESPTGSRVKWGLSSHWGDFSQVGGRLTTDEVHRALNSAQQPDDKVTVKPEYATDLGFMHAETTLNQIANYKTMETRTEYKMKKRGGLAGLVGGKKMVEVQKQVEIDHEVDLSIGLQGKYLPVVYGVQRLPGIPVFADTQANASNIVFVADAICEGEIHGLYNLYIDGVPLICTDKSDFDVRNATNGSDKDNSQLQCYGRADQGNTIGGTTDSSIPNAAANKAELFNLEPGVLEQTEDFSIDPATGEQVRIGSELFFYHQQQQALAHFFDFGRSDIPAITTGDALGLQHEEYGTIDHPFSMSFAFFKGSNTQKASSLLVNTATKTSTGERFKRQNDYYEGGLPYWSPNHRLLDTAYMANSFVISEDQTEIPDLEYVVRGRVIECYNYDNSYIPDPHLGASDSAANFSEGDIVTVEKSSNGSSWSTTNVEGDSSDTSFRILHKYTQSDNKGSTHTRFILDQTPDLDESNGIPTQTYLRLKSGSNYWHMRTYNHKSVDSATFALEKYSGTVGVNGSNEIQITFSSTHADALKNGYNTELTAAPGKVTYGLHINDADLPEFLDRAGEKNQAISLVGTWSGNVLTFEGTNMPNIASRTNINNIEVYKNRNFFFGSSNGGALTSFSNSAELTGATITIDQTGESRTIDNYNGTSKRVEIEAPFRTFTEKNFDDGLTFTISGRFADKRPSNNPAIQLLDYMSDVRYGKNLDVNNDIDLASFKASAKLCDVRSNVSVALTTSETIGAGAIYKLSNSDGDHVVSGRVASTNSITISDSSVTEVEFDLVSGKFLRRWDKYVQLSKGEYVITNEGNLYQFTSGTPSYVSTKPTHTSGTTNSLLFVAAPGTSNKITLTKESGTGPSTIAINTNVQLDYELYDSDFVKYWRYLGWEEHKQCFVTRHQTNFIIDTSKSIFENMNVFLSHFNGILSYEGGKYVLDVETKVTAPVETTTFNSVSYNWNVNPEYIDNSDIIGSISLVDNTQRQAKNSIKASIPDPQNNFASRSVSFFNSKFLEADRKVVKNGTFNYTGITNYYNARIGVEKELIQSRFSKEISFTVGQKGLLLKAGQVIALTYPPLGYSSKLFRIENLNFNANCTVAVKAREYDDSIYVISAQRASELRQEAATQAQPLRAPEAITSLAATTTRPGSVILTWNNPASFVDESDDIEIWASDTNNRSNANLIYIADSETSFTYTTAQAGTKYYWGRVRRTSRQLGNKTRILTSAFHPSGATNGVTGVSKILSPALLVNTNAILIKFDASGNLDPSGASQDVTINVTRQNLTGTPTIQLLDADESSQSDMQFTDGSTSVTGTSATVDASTATTSTTPKLVKVSLTESGETFSNLISIGILQAGSVGADGDDGKRTIQGYLYQESTGTSAPSAPSGNTYTFATGLVTGTGINDSGTTNVWKNAPNTHDAGGSNTYWTVRYFGTEASAGSSTVSVSYSTVVKQTDFSGVVTFSNGTFNEVGTGAITTIDGDNITTGQIQSNITSETSTFTGAGALFDLDNAEIKTPFFYSTNSGAGFKGTVTIGSTDLTANNTLNSNTSASDVGLGSIGTTNTAILQGGFDSNTLIDSGKIKLAGSSGATTNFIEIDGTNGRIIIADNS